MKVSENNKINEIVSETQKKVYSSPVLSVYGNIERQTAGGSGNMSEGMGTDTNKFP